MQINPSKPSDKPPPKVRPPWATYVIAAVAVIAVGAVGYELYNAFAPESPDFDSGKKVTNPAVLVKKLDGGWGDYQFDGKLSVQLPAKPVIQPEQLRYDQTKFIEKHATYGIDLDVKIYVTFAEYKYDAPFKHEDIMRSNAEGIGAGNRVYFRDTPITFAGKEAYRQEIWFTDNLNQKFYATGLFIFDGPTMWSVQQLGFESTWKTGNDKTSERILNSVHLEN